MIVSHKHRFIFIKTIKTAGTSVEVYLSQFCGPDDVLTPIYPPVEGHVPRNYARLFNPLPELVAPYMGKPGFPSRLGVMRQFIYRRPFFNHMPAVSARARLGDKIWNDYFKFCVERNPFEKTVSFYNMQLKRREVTDVEDFFKKGRYPRDWNRYSDFQVGPIVDRVLKYENLNSELGEVFEKLGIPYSGSLDVRSKGDYRSSFKTHHELFDAPQRKILEARFAQECEAFGYSWDDR